MRIAYMLTSLGIGGAERQVIAIAERMAARGHHVLVIVLLSRREHEFPTDIKVVRLDMVKSLSGLLRGLWRGRRVLDEFRPDILHSHTFPANMAARLLHLIGAAPKVLSTIHNINEGGWWRTLAYHLTDPLTIHTTAVSRAVANRYLEIRAVPRDKCSVITNGIDVDLFKPLLEKALRDLESQHERGTFVWLAAGRPVAAKDFQNLLAAFCVLRRESPSVQLWIAGERDIEESETHGLRWLGHCSDMAATVAAADGFVLSSAWEGMPLVVGEAMAMEKPVVATDVGGVRELLGDAGVLVPARDSEALAAAMQRIMRMTVQERQQMGRAARMRIMMQFDLDDKARQWERCYSELMSDHAQSHVSHAC
jgi:glycosyltransferase involved in cell wall biosynthesis